MISIPRAARLGRAPTLGLVLVLGAGLLSGAALMSAAEGDSLGGRAFSAFVDAPTLGVNPTYVADTGALPPDGGWEDAGLADVEFGAALAAQTLVASTSGSALGSDARQASTSTSLSSLVLFAGTPAEVTASFVRAEAAASLAGLTGVSELDQLTFGGVPVDVTGVPNQTVDIPGVATLVINEQAIATGSSSRAITVNALHLKLATGEEAIVSSATSSIAY